MKLNDDQTARLKFIAKYLKEASHQVSLEARTLTCDVEMLEAAFEQLKLNVNTLEKFLENECYTDGGRMK